MNTLTISLLSLFTILLIGCSKDEIQYEPYSDYSIPYVIGNDDRPFPFEYSLYFYYFRLHFEAGIQNKEEVFVINTQEAFDAIYTDGAAKLNQPIDFDTQTLVICFPQFECESNLIEYKYSVTKHPEFDNYLFSVQLIEFATQTPDKYLEYRPHHFILPKASNVDQFKINKSLITKDYRETGDLAISGRYEGTLKTSNSNGLIKEETTTCNAIFSTDIHDAIVFAIKDDDDQLSIYSKQSVIFYNRIVNYDFETPYGKPTGFSDYDLEVALYSKETNKLYIICHERENDYGLSRTKEYVGIKKN